MEIFTPVEEEYFGPIKEAEPQAVYLNKSGELYDRNVRLLMEEFISNYPDQEKNKILRLLISKDDSEFTSSYFELILFNLLKRVGSGIEVNPVVDEKGKNPDFLFEKDSKKVFIEALSIERDIPLKLSEKKRVNPLIDEVNKIKNKEFYLFFRKSGYVKNPPPITKIKKEIADWVGSLDYDLINKSYSKLGSEALPKKIIHFEKSKFIFTATPYSSVKDENYKHRLISGLSGAFGWNNTRTKIINSARNKRKKYKNLSHPLILAINIQHYFRSQRDEVQALYGQEAWQVNVQNDDDLKVTRINNGLWHGKTGVENSKIQGVLFFWGLNPWTISKRKPVFYQNPYSEDVTHFFKEFSLGILEKGNIKYSEGATLGEIFGLEPTWPEKLN